MPSRADVAANPYEEILQLTDAEGKWSAQASGQWTV